MYRTKVLSLCLLFSAVMFQISEAATPLQPTAQWIPPNAIITLEVTQPDDLLDLLLSQKIEAAVKSLPVYQQLTTQSGFSEFQGVIAYLETMLGLDWHTGVQKIFGGGVTLAILPEDNVLLIIEAKDVKTLNQLHDIILGFARDDNPPGAVTSREYEGHTIHSLGEEQAHVIIENRFVWSKRPETIESVLNRHKQPDTKSLSDSPAYQSARKTAGDDATIVSYIDMKTLKQIPQVRHALSQGLNPLLALIFAEIPDVLLESNWIALGLRAEAETLTLKSSMDGTTAGISRPISFAIPKQPGKGALHNITVPRQIAGLSFYRDLHQFYSAKDELFPERTSGLIFFENMMGIFFTGRDLTEEVLGELQPEIRFVVSEQAYDPSIGTPRLQVPSFAVIFRMRQPEKFAKIAEEAWQKAVGLINFTRGQQADPGLIIDRPEHGKTKFTMAYFSSDEEESKTNLDTHYNFRPSIVTLDEHLILSSTDGIAKDLIDFLQKEKDQSLPNTHSLVNMDILQLASILKANRDNMVRQNMLEKGLSQEQAEAEFDILVSVMQFFDRAQLKLGNQQDRTEARLDVQLNLPEGTN